MATFDETLERMKKIHQAKDYGSPPSITAIMADISAQMKKVGPINARMSQAIGPVQIREAKALANVMLDLASCAVAAAAVIEETISALATGPVH